MDYKRFAYVLVAVVLIFAFSIVMGDVFWLASISSHAWR